MERVIQRTAVARRRAAGRREKLLKKKMIIDRVHFRQNLVQRRREQLDAMKEERKVRREKWELGPLSPHYDASKAGKQYGAWSQAQMSLPVKPKMLRIPFWYIKPGDRVCVINGHPSIKGLIGEVSEISKKTETVTIQDMNKVTILNPARDYDESASPTTTVPAAIPLDDVRLVYPLEDPLTGTKKDCIITTMKRVNMWDKEERKMRWMRVVHPQGFVIPWPKVAETAHKDHDSDTLAFEAAQTTFQPTLLGPPMPESVIDELRGKFSAFRTRHTDEYIAEKTLQDEMDNAVKGHSEALKPRGARNIARQGSAPPGTKGSEPQRQPKLDDGIAAIIGAHMAAHRVKFTASRLSKSVQ